MFSHGRSVRCANEFAAVESAAVMGEPARRSTPSEERNLT